VENGRERLEEAPPRPSSSLFSLFHFLSSIFAVSSIPGCSFLKTICWVRLHEGVSLLTSRSRNGVRPVTANCPLMWASPSPVACRSLA